MKIFLKILLFLLLTGCPNSKRDTRLSTIYVASDSAAPSPDGSRWSTAYPTIQAAIEKAKLVRSLHPEISPVIAVKHGTYRPSASHPASVANLHGLSRVKLLGGYEGLCECPEDQKPGLFQSTILSGKLTQQDAQRAGKERASHVIDIGYDNWILSSGEQRVEDIHIRGFRVIEGEQLNQHLEGGGGAGMVATTIKGRTGDGKSIPSSLLVEDVTFSNNRAPAGGALEVRSAELTLKRVNFESNQANNGGAISVRNFSTLVMENCSLKDNRAESGGALWIFSDATADVKNSSFEKNAATDSGGAIRIRGNSGLTLESVQIVNNMAKNGGGVYISPDYQSFEKSLTWFKGVTFKENIASNDGGAIYNDGSSVLALIIKSELVISDSAFAGNKTGNEGGGLFNQGTATINKTTFLGNESGSGQGGAIQNSIGELRLFDGEQRAFSNNLPLSEIFSGFQGVSNSRGNITIIELKADLECRAFFGFSDDQNLTASEIRSRARTLALRYHPDKGGTQEQFEKLIACRDVLLGAL